MSIPHMTHTHAHTLTNYCPHRCNTPADRRTTKSTSATTPVCNQSIQICRAYLCTSRLLISISNSAVIYRLNPPQAACTASSNETHWFGWDLRSPDRLRHVEKNIWITELLSNIPEQSGQDIEHFITTKDSAVTLRGEASSCLFPVGRASYLSSGKTGKDLLCTATVKSCFVTLSRSQSETLCRVVCSGS